MNNVYGDNFMCNIVKKAKVRYVTFTNDARNIRNTVAFEKWDLVLSQNCFFFQL